MNKQKKVKTPDGYGIICGVDYSGPGRVIVKIDGLSEVRGYDRRKVKRL